MKQYGVNGLAGCVQQRVNRRTKTLVGVYNADQADLDVDSGPWATICEPHSSIVHHPSLELALSHASAPDGWCEACRDVTDPNKQETA